jgi:hypothetical protein
MLVFSLWFEFTRAKNHEILMMEKGFFPPFSEMLGQLKWITMDIPRNHLLAGTIGEKVSLQKIFKEIVCVMQTTFQPSCTACLWWLSTCFNKFKRTAFRFWNSVDSFQWTVFTQLLIVLFYEFEITKCKIMMGGWTHQLLDENASFKIKL